MGDGLKKKVGDVSRKFVVSPRLPVLRGWCFGVRWQAQRDTALDPASESRKPCTQSAVDASLCRRTPKRNRPVPLSPRLRISPSR